LRPCGSAGDGEDQQRQGKMKRCSAPAIHGKPSP
jgi:hypothetical protein